MTLQTDLQAAVDKATLASGKLHDIVNGDSASTVTTDNGEVKTLAKAVADNEQVLNDSIVDITIKRDEATASASAAANSATQAQISADKIPNPAPGNAFQGVRVDATGEFYEFADMSGNVVGPSSVTGNALVRFNGLTGKLLKETSQVQGNEINATLEDLSNVAVGANEGEVLQLLSGVWQGVMLSLFPVGMMAPYAGSSAPNGWLLCDGSAIDRTTYAALFTAIGTSFGVGDGSTTFNLPDFRGRTSVGMDNMGGASANRITNAQADTLGGTGGLENKTPSGSIGGSTGNTTLSSSQIPSHQHNQRWVNKINSTAWSPSGVSLIDMNYPVGNDGSNQVYNYIDTDIINSASGVSAADAPVTTNVAGGSGSHNHTLSASFTGSSMDVTQPWLACHMIIKI